MGPLAKDLIQRLLIKDPKKRLGSGPNGAENVKKHPFYQVDLIAFLKSFTMFRAGWAVTLHNGAASTEQDLGKMSLCITLLIRSGTDQTNIFLLLNPL